MDELLFLIYPFGLIWLMIEVGQCFKRKLVAVVKLHVLFIENLPRQCQFGSKTAHRISIARDLSIMEELKYRLKFILPSFISDIPGAEDSLSVRRVVNTDPQCFRCLISQGNLANRIFGDKRTLVDTIRLLKKLNEGGNSVKDDMKLCSMFYIPPILSKFPLLGLHGCIDIYSVFRPEPVHELSLSVSKRIKECVVQMFRYDERLAGECYLSPVRRVLSDK